MNRNISALLSAGPSRVDLSLLIVRVATGLMILPHGIYKLMDGASGLAKGLAAGGLPAAGLFAWCATLAEAVGGALMVLGLLTRPASAAVSFTMVVAWVMVHLGDLPKIGAQGGAAFEYPFLLSMAALAIAIAGGGRYSLDARLFDKRPS
ncbi:MAG: DoxX family protein [Polyangiaceae bacterium]|nr:DoxX family protein [Polyangiaceae bacterium]